MPDKEFIDTEGENKSEEEGIPVTGKLEAEDDEILFGEEIGLTDENRLNAKEIDLREEADSKEYEEEIGLSEDNNDEKKDEIAIDGTIKRKKLKLGLWISFFIVTLGIVGAFVGKKFLYVTSQKKIVPQNGSQYKNRFTQYDNKIIYDSKTNLEWFVGQNKGTTWNEAKDWAEKVLVNKEGWRLPKIQELKDLYKLGVGIRNITPLFQTTGWYVWSSAIKGSSNNARYFNFKDGYAYWFNRDFSYFSRAFAVRTHR